MSNAVRNDYYASVEDYLAGEKVSQQKHEYMAGVIYAMAGTSIGHDRVAGNVFGDLREQLRGKPCEVFSSDVKVRIQQNADQFYYYPDVTVDCSQSNNDSIYAETPKVIFEVMSPDTERIDRGEKLKNYQSLPSLDVYVLVDQFHVAVTIYRRISTGWDYEFLTELDEDILRLPTIQCELPLASIYERTGLRH